MEVARIHSPDSDINQYCGMCKQYFAKFYVYTLVLNRCYSQWFSEHKIRIRESQKAIT
jgi:hypothetical protein